MYVQSFSTSTYSKHFLELSEQEGILDWATFLFLSAIQ